MNFKKKNNHKFPKAKEHYLLLDKWGKGATASNIIFIKEMNPKHKNKLLSGVDKIASL